LGVDGFMRAVNQLPVSMGEDTAAFYPFNEYPSDVEATAATVRNVCSPLLGEGKVSNGADATAQATFDSDAPGKYVFFGTEVPSVPVYTNPASLHLTADSSVRGVQVPSSSAISAMSWHPVQATIRSNTSSRWMMPHLDSILRT
jgi:hypothetical protein